tara:strand:+ start:193 stop:369 length:177 start_codon:yes stop_codon:yes gene_type:complete
MFQLILYYLLVGTAVAFFLELVVRAVDFQVSVGERAVLIILWPIMLLVFLFNFIRGLF